MNRNNFIVFVFLLLNIINVKSQNTFDIIKNKENGKISFKLVNNLILIPVKLNGEELTFLVDTGVKQSLLFSVAEIDSVKLNHVKKIKVRGLGEDEFFEALQSKNNLLRIKDIVCPDFEILVILNKKFDFSSRMGINIHGIIGSELFKDFIVEIDYQNKKIKFNKPKTYKYKKCRKCKEFPLSFRFQKPYLNATITNEDNTKAEVKLLLDSGSGDALWLFEKTSSKINIPKKSYKDFLGKGLSGNIYGKRSKLKTLEIGNDYWFCNMLVAYPDSSSVLGGGNFFFNRNGILGAEILKRFNTIYDYQNKKITLKKNKYYSRGFYYDKSGLDVIYNGKILIKEIDSKFSYGFSSPNSSSQDVLTYSYNYKFKNSYKIALVRPKSAAENAGLLIDDIIVELNGKPAYKYTIQQITRKLSERKGTNIKMVINRRGMYYNFKFKLKDLL